MQVGKDGGKAEASPDRLWCGCSPHRCAGPSHHLPGDSHFHHLSDRERPAAIIVPNWADKGWSPAPWPLPNRNHLQSGRNLPRTASRHCRLSFDRCLRIDAILARMHERQLPAAPGTFGVMLKLGIFPG